jgi:Second Messenger Oligonucleotide or Dinucleotide Synthetase domain
MDVPEAFDALDENLKLDPDETVAAQDRHAEITETLVSAGIASGSFLQGSFARKTMLPPLHDIDKIIILTEAYRGQHPDGVMGAIEDAVAAVCSPVTFDRSKHAVKIDIADDPFLFDCVPAFESDGDDDDVLIANREAPATVDEWTRSNPRELARRIAERNQATNGRFIHQVRMVKQAVRELLGDRLPSLHVESIAYTAIETALEHPDAVAKFFEVGAELLGGEYYEPTGVDQISDRLDTAIADEAELAFINAAKRAHEAIDLAAAGDHNEAVRVWVTMFGDVFPPAPPQSANSAVEKLTRGGSVTSAAAVSATRAGRTPAPTTRSWHLA